MDKFIVSARKYRPQTFDTVVGQAHITTTLKNAIKNNQLAHAFLFCGPRGVGKTTCARILAKTINCEKIQKDGEACNKCNSCKSFNEGTSLNIHELDAASNNSVDDIRTLTEQVRFAPQAGKYKVYIIDEVHMLSSSAFNAFLKTLEEPPPYAIFILATTEKHKILPTILSRCQIFDFKRITLNDTVEHLEEICEKEEIKSDKAALQVIAQKSEGCMRDALSILDKIVSFTNSEVTYQNTLEHLNILDADYYFKLLDHTQQQDLAAAMLLFDDINRKGFEGDMVVNGFAEFIRNLLVCKDEKAAVLLEAVESFKEKYIAAAKKTPASWLISALNVLNEAEINYKAARNKRLHVELALIKLTYLVNALQLTGDAEAGKKKLVETAKPLAFRTISPIKLKSKLTDDSGQMTEANKQPATGNRQSGEARVTIEEPVSIVEEDKPVTTQPQTTNYKPQTTISPEARQQPATKLNTLEKIRQQVAQNNKANGNAAIPLSIEELHHAWNAYIRKLEESNDPSAVTNFRMAELQLNDANTFEIIVGSNIQQKFIEQKRATLIEHLQHHFCNKNLTYQLTLVEKADDTEPKEKPLNTREQFFRIAEQYPLVKELKDRLGLELDY
ncbi:MAG: DNA polymerase III subunit gamma/tau [Sphingobacteriales bacterium]|nr:DNA polymerase III subunit gamma/tau [Sphingobacteriales bacterium]